MDIEIHLYSADQLRDTEIMALTGLPPVTENDACAECGYGVQHRAHALLMSDTHLWRVCENCLRPALKPHFFDYFGEALE